MNNPEERSEIYHLTSIHNIHTFNFPTPSSCIFASPHLPLPNQDFPNTLASRGYNALLPLETPVSF